MRVLRMGFSLSAAEVEDVVQESFIRAFRHLDQLRDPARFGLWVQMIARREALASVGSQAARQHTDVALAAESALLVEQAPPEEPAVQIVRALLAELEEGPERKIVHRFYVDGDCTVQQLADELGLAKGTITSRLSRFRARIKRRLVARVAGADPDFKRGRT